MTRHPQFPFPFPFCPPTPAEVEAIRTVTRYLDWTTNAVGTRLLQPWLPPDEAALLTAFRGQTQVGAALGEGLLDLAPGMDQPG